MSVGIFMGIGASYVERAKDVGIHYLAAINTALRERGLGAYVDPKSPPNVYRDGLFGRSALDHHSVGAFVALGELAEEEAGFAHLELLATNPYRVAFLPTDFAEPFEIQHSELIAGERPRLWVGSAPRLSAELLAMAGRLDIPVAEGAISDAVAQQINAMEPLFEGDTLALAEDERTAWLALFEGARLAVQRGVALSLAG